MENNKKLALGGVIGGCLYALSSILLHWSGAMTGENPDPGWLTMGAMRCGAAELLALLGSVGLLAGFNSLYRMVKESCGKKMTRLSLIPVVGVVGMALFHGNVSCIEPLLYPILAKGSADSLYPDVDAAISGSFAPVDLIILVTFYLQLIPLFYGVFSGRFGVKKGLIILNPILGLILGLVLGAILPSPIKAISFGLRNLGEGLMYLIPLAYWKVKE